MSVLKITILAKYGKRFFFSCLFYTVVFAVDFSRFIFLCRRFFAKLTELFLRTVHFQIGVIQKEYSLVFSLPFP